MFWLYVAFFDPTIGADAGGDYVLPQHFDTQSDCIRYYDDWKHTADFLLLAEEVTGKEAGPNLQFKYVCWTTAELKAAGFERPDLKVVQVGEEK